MTEAGAAYRERHLSAQDSLPLYYREYGDALSAGAPVVCLGGLTRNSKDFHDLATHLAPDRRVVCPDYRGRGRSAYDPEWRNYNARTYINDIKHLLAAANLHGTVFVGISLGGVLAMVMCVAAPIGVAGVVLNDIGPTVPSEGFGRILEYIKTDRPQPDWETAARHLRKLLPTLGLADDAEWLRMARPYLPRGPRRPASLRLGYQSRPAAYRREGADARPLALLSRPAPDTRARHPGREVGHPDSRHLRSNGAGETGPEAPHRRGQRSHPDPRRARSGGRDRRAPRRRRREVSPERDSGRFRFERTRSRVLSLAAADLTVRDCAGAPDDRRAASRPGAIPEEAEPL